MLEVCGWGVVVMGDGFYNNFGNGMMGGVVGDIVCWGISGLKFVCGSCGGEEGVCVWRGI